MAHHDSGNRTGDGQGGGGPRLRVAISGASGLIGGSLAASLRAQGHEVHALVRKSQGQPPGSVFWDPAGGAIDAAGLEGMDAVVHLAAESIASRWTAAKKEAIRSSRVEGTRLLASALADLKHPPGVFVTASAIGYYGDRGAEPLTEASGPGRGFLAEVGQAWEASAQPAEAAGIRTVRLRIGMVLTPRGGALAKMLPIFRLGMGGPLGTGRQYISWIGLTDLVGALNHAIRTESLAGAVNATAPNPVTNREFARTLGRVLGRPAILPAPAVALRLMLGAMADELLLSGCRVLPERLKASGYVFREPGLDGALRRELGAEPDDAAG